MLLFLGTRRVESVGRYRTELSPGEYGQEDEDLHSVYILIG